MSIAVSLWVIDNDTGEPIYIPEQIPSTVNADEHVADLMQYYSGYTLDGWDFIK